MIDQFFQYLGIICSILGVGFTARELNRRRARKLSWNQIEKGVADLAAATSERGYDPDVIVGIGKGGSIVAAMLSVRLGYKPVYHVDRQIKYRAGDGLPESVVIVSSVLPIQDLKVLLVNGESNSGWTLAEVKRLLQEMRPKAILTAAIVAMSKENAESEHVLCSPDIYSIVRSRRQLPPWKQ